MQTTNYRQQVVAVVRAELARRNLSRSDLATALGISYRTLHERLSCRSPFDLDEIRQVADFLDVDVLALISAGHVA